jgi:cystathionine beta-lyase
MIYDFDAVPDRRSTDSSKWHYYEPDVLPMWVADMDFRSPEPVIRALRQRVEQGIFGYPKTIGAKPQYTHELYQAITQWLAARHGWQVQAEHLVLLQGVIPGLNLACRTFAGGKGILVQPPVYDHILHAAEHTGAQSQQAALSQGPDGVYGIDFEAFEAAITPETRLFVLCNPHNPVGRVFRPDELSCLAEICLRHDVILCSDDIHADLVYPGYCHVPLASLSPEIANNTITLMSPSKTFNLAGLKFAFAVIPNPELRQRFTQADEGLLGWVNLMGVVAAQAAYADGAEWLEQLLRYLQANQEAVLAFVQQELPGMRMVKSEGTFMAWLDCRQAHNPEAARDPFTFFLEKARVGLSNGKNFGAQGEGFVRLNFGCPRPMLLEALEKMKKAWIG